MLKFGAHVFYINQPPDAYGAVYKRVLSQVVRRSRDFVKGVVNGRFGRQAADVVGVRVFPGSAIVPTQARSLQNIQKSFTEAWKCTLNIYAARNPGIGFVGRYARSYGTYRAFETWKDGAKSYHGLAKRIALFGVVGVAVGTNRQADCKASQGSGNVDVYSTVRDMFTVAPKQETVNEMAAKESFSHLQFGTVVSRDCCGVVFEAEVADCQCELASGPETESQDAVMMTMLDDQTLELTHLLEMVAKQQSQLQQLLKLPDVKDDDIITRISPANPTPVSLVCCGSLDDVLGLAERCIDEQQRQLAHIECTVQRQNAKLRTVFAERQQRLLDDDDDDEDDDDGFIILSSETVTEIKTAEADDIMTSLTASSPNFNVGSASSFVVSEDKKLAVDMNNDDDVVHSLFEINNKTAGGASDMRVRVRVMACGGEPADETLSQVNEELILSPIIWWSHPTQPPDCNGSVKEMPAHQNVLKPECTVVVSVVDLFALLDGCQSSLSEFWTSDVAQSQDLAICTVYKKSEMTLAEFLSSHSVDISVAMAMVLQLFEGVVHLCQSEVPLQKLDIERNTFVETVNGDPMLKIPCFVHCRRCSKRQNDDSLLKSIVGVSADIVNAYSSDGDNSTLCFTQNVNMLIKSLLIPTEPDLRVDVVRVANALYLLTWAPSNCLSFRRPVCVAAESVQEWIVQQAAEIYCHRMSGLHFADKLVKVRMSLQEMFLARVETASVVDALKLLKTLC